MGKKVVVILGIIILVLASILGYGVYQGIKAKEIILNLQESNQQLALERENLRNEMGLLQDKYHLLEMDMSKIYKTCPYENKCKGRFPMISWYCNDQGDLSPDVVNAPYICVCNADCQLNQTIIRRD